MKRLFLLFRDLNANTAPRRWAVVCAVGLSAAAASVFTAQPAVAAPNFQLPFQCGQVWELNPYGDEHAPALDMTREPDQSGTEGALLLAPAAGTVTVSRLHERAGHLIQIDHGGRSFTTYIHLQVRSVSVGQKVSQGQQIGRVGHTGETSNDVPHLHYEQGYDADGDGQATWGEVGTERVDATFDGVTYSQGDGQGYDNVESRNCGPADGPDPDAQWRTQFADIDGDGRDEIISLNSSGQVRAWRNTGGLAGNNQTYTAGYTLIATGFTVPHRTHFADIDGDDRAEIVALYDNGDVYAWRNTGGLAGNNQTYTAGSTLIARGFTTPARVRFADVDVDGWAEIIVIYPSGEVRAWRNTGRLIGGNQTYTAGSVGIAEGFTNPAPVHFADIDGDGRDEIASNYGSGDVVAWHNSGGFNGDNGTYTGGTLIAEGFTDHTTTRFARVDADGRAEIVGIRAAGDATYAWHNTGGLAGDNQTYSPSGTLIARGFS